LPFRARRKNFALIFFDYRRDFQKKIGYNCQAQKTGE